MTEPMREPSPIEMFVEKSGWVVRRPDAAIPVREFKILLKKYTMENNLDDKGIYEEISKTYPKYGIAVRRMQVGDLDEDFFVGVEEACLGNVERILFKKSSMSLDKTTARKLVVPMMTTGGYIDSGDIAPVRKCLETLFGHANPVGLDADGCMYPLTTCHVISFCLDSVKDSVKDMYPL